MNQAAEAIHYLLFSLVPEIGSRRLMRLVQAFGTAVEAWQASESALQSAGLERRPLEQLLHARKQLNAEVEWEKVQRAGARVITLRDDEYPPSLRSLGDAPPVLYIKGTLLPDDQRAIGIVGTRKATPYGRDIAAQFSKVLASHRVAVISGLAHGIDAAAHRGALEGHGRTIAVLGNGIDTVYPPDHRELAKAITGQGALITEFPIGAKPEARHFPRRNRLISGLALGILVVEAPLQSGALITADFAIEQGREVFAVPGSIHSHASSGTNRLIQEGAKLVTSVEDILEELNIAHEKRQTHQVAREVSPDSPLEAEILKHLSADPLHIDDLVRLAGLPVSTVNSMLTILELKGAVRAVGSHSYSRAV